jgi:hypothetical protein
MALADDKRGHRAIGPSGVLDQSKALISRAFALSFLGKATVGGVY